MFNFSVGGSPGPGATPPFIDNSPDSFTSPGFFVDLAQLGTQTFLANQAITAKNASSIQILPNGGVLAAGGGAGLTATTTGASLFSNPLVLVFVLIILVVLLRR